MRLVRLSAVVTVALLTFVAGIRADPIASGAIQVLDGDTIATRGQTVRLVGFDTPEAGMNATCEAERALAARATGKLRQLVAGGGLDLSLVRCSCPAGTEGTQACNYGRACGILKVTGKDVAELLIADGLAKPFHCSRDRCPKRGAVVLAYSVSADCRI